MLIPSRVLQALNLASFASIKPTLNKTGSFKKKIWKSGEGDLAGVKTDTRRKHDYAGIYTMNTSISQIYDHQNVPKRKKMLLTDYEKCCHKRPEKSCSFIRGPCDLVLSSKTVTSSWPVFLPESTQKKISTRKMFIYFFLLRIRFKFLHLSSQFPVSFKKAVWRQLLERLFQLRDISFYILWMILATKGKETEARKKYFILECMIVVVSSKPSSRISGWKSSTKVMWDPWEPVVFPNKGKYATTMCLRKFPRKKKKI